MATTTTTIALRTPGHCEIFPADRIEDAKAAARRYHSDGERSVSLKWHHETRQAATETSSALGTCTNCGAVIVASCGALCDCEWEVGGCNMQTGAIGSMSTFEAAEAARETLNDAIEGCGSFADLCDF